MNSGHIDTAHVYGSFRTCDAYLPLPHFAVSKQKPQTKEQRRQYCHSILNDQYLITILCNYVYVILLLCGHQSIAFVVARGSTRTAL